jgi:ABC-2 type transport system ATP-binding protein
MRKLIETFDLSKTFGDFVAVDGVSLSVEEGEVLALLGPNGAGKTTTIRMLASILSPTYGRASIAGYDIVQNKREVRFSIGMLTEHHGLYRRMRPMEYLRFFGRTYQMPQDEIDKRIVELLNYLELDDAFDKRLGEFSKGMRQKLALARSMLHDPPVLLLDEPTSAMDPSSARLVRESILSLRSTKRSIIVCTHNLSEAELLADRIAIIRDGQIVVLGTPDELKQKVLGDQIMEIKLAKPLNSHRPQFPDSVRILSQGSDWIRYSVSSPFEVNPLVLKSLSDLDLPVVTLSRVERSLEEVYLRVIKATGQEVGE